MLLQKLETKTKAHKKTVSVFVVIFLVSIIIEIWTANRLATYGEKINQLQKATDSLSLENQLLSDQIAMRSSLSQTEQSVDALGFVPMGNLQYLNTPTIAFNH